MKTSNITKKVFIVDDHPVVRQGLTQFIDEEEGFMVCGEAEDVNSAIMKIEEKGPDIVIVDITLRDGSGLDLTKAIKSRFNIPVLILSMHEEEFYAERALRAGAKGYVMKKESMIIVIEAMREILAGRTFLRPAVKERIFEKLIQSGEESQTLTDSLTNREIEVLKYIGDGFSNRNIADELGISVKTVETYRSRIIEKMMLHGSAELVRFAIDWRQHEGKNL